MERGDDDDEGGGDDFALLAPGLILANEAQRTEQAREAGSGKEGGMKEQKERREHTHAEGAGDGTGKHD